MINVEIKARLPEKMQRIKILTFLEKQKYVKGEEAEFRGTDKQTDTYFIVPKGRLKLREGNIENCLIQYDRPNQAGPKISQYILTQVKSNSTLKESLTKALGVLAVVKKVREIWYIGNVKIHLDKVEDLGYFLEIEARDEKEVLGKGKLLEQCDKYMSLFEVAKKDLITKSYSDMILTWKGNKTGV